MLIDTHCHLTHDDFKKDFDAVIERAKQAGFAAILCSGINRPTNEQTLALAKKYPMIKASLGLYPIDLIGLAPDEIGLSYQKNINLDDELEFIQKHLKETTAIGEVGLDYYWSKEEFEHKKQRENFQKIIEFVEKINKPIVVHTRKAEADCIAMLEASKIKHVLLHTFEGNKKLIKKAADLGYFFSVPTKVAHDQHFQMLVSMVDINQIFTETDAPYLSPIKGQRNEPAFIAHSIKKIAEIKKISEKEVEDTIYKNFNNVFNPQK